MNFIPSNAKSCTRIPNCSRERYYRTLVAKCSVTSFKWHSLLWELCHGVFVLHFVTRDIFGLTCRRSRLEHVIMWHFELENCNFCRRLVFGFEGRMFWQVLAGLSVLKPVTVGLLLVSNKIYHKLLECS